MVSPLTTVELKEIGQSPQSGSPATPDELAEINANVPTGNDSLLQSAAGAINSVVGPSLEQIGSQESMQPYKSVTEPITSLFPRANGNPLSQAWESVKSLLQIPTRLSATLGAASGPVSNATAEYLGSKGVPAPLSAALAIAAGAASDPRSSMTMG